MGSGPTTSLHELSEDRESLIHGFIQSPAYQTPRLGEGPVGAPRAKGNEGPSEQVTGEPNRVWDSVGRLQRGLRRGVGRSGIEAEGPGHHS